MMLVMPAIGILWGVGLVVYRVFLSPLAKFPGRKLAAWTMWYEFYYQAVKGGQYPWEIQKMHEEYGPIVRINPHELHINDPDYYNELYSFKPLNKYQWHTRQFGHPDSSANTPEHELHKLRTAAIAPYFQRGMVLRLEQNVIHETLLKLCMRIEEFKKSGQPMPLGLAYRAFTTDVISKYTMSASFDFVDRPDFNEQWFEQFLENVRLVHIISHFPWYPRFAKRMPKWLRKFLIPAASQLVDFHHKIEQEVVKTSHKKDVLNTAHGDTDVLPTVFYEMAHNPKVPAEEKSINRLTDEGVLFIVAGNETTGNALSIITFHVLNDSKIKAKLQKELLEVIPDERLTPQWQYLETLPYLSAVIKEGLRMSYGVVSRMPRVSPDEVLRYKDWVIPPNTPVSMNNMDMHNDPAVFVDPFTFWPERWLQSNSSELQKHLVPFCRGTRACVGQNLAYAEMYLTLAVLFRKFDFELHDTTRAEVDPAHEYHIPQVKRGSKGVRVFVK